MVILLPEYGMKKLFFSGILLLILLVCLFGSRYFYVKINYPETVKQIEIKRLHFLKAYQSATSIKERNDIIDQARTYLHETLTSKIFPSWLGTPWSFNGDADFPLQGSIACGSFVEKVLKQTGFRIDSRMSSQPSEYIIRNMVKEEKTKRFSNVPIDTFNDEIKKLGEGLFIIGLDSHVGFLYIFRDKYRFVHAHGYLCVVSEIPSLSPILRSSKYRVVGKLFDREMMERWLYNKEFPLKFNYFNNSL